LLRERILMGDLPPGRRLTESRLSDQLEVSRATIRAALNHLAFEQLVDLTPYTGWTTRALTSHDAWELYTLRGSLEGLAARIASEKINAENSRSLKHTLGLLGAACKSKDSGAIAAADYALHVCIIDLCEHKRLRAQYTSLEQQVRRYIALSDDLLMNKTDIFEQHRPLVDAIVSGDADAADEIAKNHNLSEGKVLVMHLQELENKQRDSL
jgi:DNA-binding GntR family transcriptional regulator